MVVKHPHHLHLDIGPRIERSRAKPAKKPWHPHGFHPPPGWAGTTPSRSGGSGEGGGLERLPQRTSALPILTCNPAQVAEFSKQTRSVQKSVQIWADFFRSFEDEEKRRFAQFAAQQDQQVPPTLNLNPAP